jgi:hypothetical protein
VRSISRVPTSALHRLSEEVGATWSPQQALALGSQLLGWMRTAAERRAGEHLRFSYDGVARVAAAEAVEGGDLPGRLEVALRELRLGPGPRPAPEPEPERDPGAAAEPP